MRYSLYSVYLEASCTPYWIEVFSNCFPQTLELHSSIVKAIYVRQINADGVPSEG